MKKSEYIAPVLLVLVSIGILGFFIYVSTTRNLTNLELVISQTFALIIGFSDHLFSVDNQLLGLVGKSSNHMRGLLFVGFYLYT